MRNQATCDRCKSSIQKPNGYLWYSAFVVKTPHSEQETGNMLLCESCTESIFAQRNAVDAETVENNISEGLPADIQKLRYKVQDGNTASIISLYKKHNFLPKQAKEKARQFALMWWKNPQQTQQEAALFWTSVQEPKTLSGQNSDRVKAMDKAIDSALDAVFGLAPLDKNVSFSSQKRPSEVQKVKQQVPTNTLGISNITPAKHGRGYVPKIRFKCPNCHKLLGAAAKLAEKKKKCPACNVELVVPSISQSDDS
ncbi:hypothetical protein JW935_23155 [candidate division KSB1 bacterium]|nr:hypothetical protein [candidate division KSB1 bacterium]